MEKLAHKRLQAIAALQTLQESIAKFSTLDDDDYFYPELRDSVIKRFEYSIDTFWKYLKEYIEKNHAIIPPASPKGVFKLAIDTQIISIDEEKELRVLIENRNLTSHAYNIELARSIGKIIPERYLVMQTIINRLFD